MSGVGDPVLLMNGLARSLDSWTPFTDGLCDRTVITYDAPGVGQSQTPTSYFSMRMLADVGCAVLDHFGIAASDVVGFSHGGAVAQEFAARHQDRTNRLVLLATSCGLGSVPGRFDDLTRLLFSRRLRRGSSRPDLPGLLWQIAAISTWSSIPLLGSISAPTLVVCGLRDRIVPPANSTVIAQRIPDARLVSLPVGHDLQKSDVAATVAALVDNFLADRT
ncbi:alpha/beta fold hydrolase [Mycolicibacterium sp.]|uniref:alpha/beta fold hydrolase n=1 Tax=Mycolicibacterium sp. TaxID=2320850 RepID=UPI0037C96A8C